MPTVHGVIKFTSLGRTDC